MIVLGGLLWAICWWAGMVIPDWCTALGLQCIWVVAGGLGFARVFAGFSGSTLWLIIGTFILAAAISKTGLLRRISLNLMKLFPPNFRGQVLAMLTVGTVCSPLMPSSTAKSVLGAKLAESSADLMSYPANSCGRSGLFVAAWTGFRLTTPAFLSASFLTYSLIGAMPESYADVSWMQWLLAMIPWLALVLLGMFALTMLYYPPERRGNFSKAEINVFCLDMGKIKKEEKLTAAIMSVCLLFWFLEKSIGISAGAVALVGGIACFACGVLDGKEICTGVPWGFVMFTGVVLNMGNVFVDTGISVWLLSLTKPLFEQVKTPYLVIIITFIITVALRFALASQTAVITLLISVLSPIVTSIGIHPIVIGLVIYTATFCWIVMYQNPTYLSALESMNGTVRHGATIPAAVGYLILALLACLISVPYWGMMGYM